MPSLFRGVVVADSPLGVRVVSVEDKSQAHLADLRPDDIIVRIQEADVRSIDEFASLSGSLKGRVVSTTVVIFRHGTPRALLLHLYSYPVLRQWGAEFVPDFELRFADPRVGFDYWLRLARGFEIAGNPAQAREAYLNALHNVPQDAQTAFRVTQLFLQESQQRLQEGSLADGVGQLRQGLLIMQRLFGDELTEEQLRSFQRQLRELLTVLRASTRPSVTRPS